MPEERLQKILAKAGIGSRRTSEEMITAGRVTVNGHVVTELGFKVDPAQAEIRVDGRPVAAETYRYIMLNKPAGYISGTDPRSGYPSWQELVQVPERLFPVGRLDQDSEGLLLLTNDGELANQLTHPRYGHAKTYLAEVEGVPNPRKIRRLQHGVMLEDGPTAPADVTLLRTPPIPFAQKGPPQPGTKRSSWLRVTLREGRKRQLRRMVGLLNHPARRIIRIGLGPLELGTLRPGKWRDLTSAEVRALRDAARRRIPTGGKKQEPERKPIPLRPSTIAIDGPAASGKSTIGGRLARDLGYLYLDTGVMYRAVTWETLRRGVPVENEAAVTAVAEQVKIDVLSPTVDDGRDVTVLVDGKDITPELRLPAVERAVSPVSAYPGVRKAMTLEQRRIGEAGNVVMVGRDIGTVVLPDADLKIYLDAALAERARRRYLERKARGEDVEMEQVLADMRRRDQIDSSREFAPLQAAPDAIIIDSTDLSIEEVMEQTWHLIERWKRRAQSANQARTKAR